jgi:hypothetical protein
VASREIAKYFISTLHHSHMILNPNLATSILSFPIWRLVWSLRSQTPSQHLFTVFSVEFFLCWFVDTKELEYQIFSVDFFSVLVRRYKGVLIIFYFILLILGQHLSTCSSR